MKIFLSDHFLKKHKKYLKKFRSLQSDISFCLENFSKSRSVPLGKKIYKVRFSSSDYPKGKRGSFRLIIYLLEIRDIVLPINIYLKSDKKNILKAELIKDLQAIKKELTSKNFFQ